MIIGAARDHVVAARHKHLGHFARVSDHLCLVGFEIFAHRFFEADRLGCDHLHERAALALGENRKVKLLLQLWIAAREDDAATGATQSFVGSRRGHVGNIDWARVCATGNQTGDVSHINHKPSAYRVSDVAETLPVDDLRIGRETRHDHLWFMLAGKALDFVVIDLAGLGIQAILHCLIDTPRKIYASPVSQVTPVGEAHAQYRIARLHERHVNRGVRL